MDEVRYRVGSGERILFWLDRWVGDRPLVFNCARDKEAKLQDYLERKGGQVVWGPTLRTNLTETEEGQLVDLLRFLQNVQIYEEDKDSRVWAASRDGLFSVSSFFAYITRSDRVECKSARVWKIKAHPRVLELVGLPCIRKFLLWITSEKESCLS